MLRLSSWAWTLCPLVLSLAGCARSQTQSAPAQNLPPLVPTIGGTSAQQSDSVQIPADVPREQWAKWMLEHSREKRAAALKTEVDSNLPALLSGMAAMEAKGDYNQVLLMSKRLGQQMPSNPQIYYLTGRAHFFQGQFDEANAQWTKAVALDATLGAKIEPLQSQMMRVRKAYPLLQLKPVVLVPSDVRAQEMGVVDRAVSLLKGRQFAELDKACQKLHQKGVVAADGYSEEFLFCDALAKPYYKSVFGTEAKQAQVREKAWKETFAFLEEWKRTQPRSQWAQLVAFRAWNRRAWDLRGEDYANKVSEQQWEQVHEALAKEAQIAAALPSSAKETSLFWQTTLSFSLLAGVPREQIEAIYKESEKHHFKDRAVDFEMTTILLPQWLGVSGEWQRWMVARADSIGGEAGDIAYGQMALAKADFFDEDTFWKKTGLSWPRAKRGFEAMLRHHPDSVSLATWLLVNADKNRDRATAKAMVLRLNNRANESKWNYVSDFARLRMRVLDPAS